jgi:hypothetical protein
MGYNHFPSYTGITGCFSCFSIGKFALSKFIPPRGIAVVEAHFTEVPFTISCRGTDFPERKKFYLDGRFITSDSTDGQRLKKGDPVAKVYNYNLKVH